MNIISQLKVLIGAESDGLNQALAQTEQRVSAWSGKVSGLLSGVSFGVVSISALAAADKFEEAAVRIQRSTGATGEKLEGLERSFENVYKKTAASSEQVSQTLALLSTRSQATGKDLENLTLKTIQLSKTQQEDVGAIVPLVTRAFGDWSIASADQARIMDYLRVTSQQTGTQVTRLAEQVVYAGAPLRQLGFSFEQATALIGKFEKEGVNTELVLGGMKTALQKFMKDGITDTAAAWKEFVAGVKSGAISAQQVMQEVGVKRGVDLYKAITEGRFEIDEMVNSLKKLEDQGGQNLETMRSKTTKWTHEIEALIARWKDFLIALGVGLPIITNLGGVFLKVGGAALSVIGSISTALRFGLVGALSTVETAILASGIVAFIAALTAGAYKLGDVIQKKFAPGGNAAPNHIPYQVYGHSVVPEGPKPGIPDSVVSYIDSLPAKPSTPALAGNGKGEQDAAEAREKYLKDLAAAESLLGVNIAKLRDSGAALEMVRQSYLNGTNGILVYAEALKGYNAILKNTSVTLGELWDAKMKAGVLTGPTPFQLTAPQAEFMHPGPSLDQLKQLPQTFDWLKESIVQTYVPIGEFLSQQALLNSNAEITAEAFRYFGESTSEELQKAADTATEKYQLMEESGIASAEALERAWIKAERAINEADYANNRISKAEHDARVKNLDSNEEDMKADTKATKTKIQNRYDLARETESMAHHTFDSIERGLAQNVVQWKGWSETIKNVGGNLATDFLSILLKGLFKPLEDQFAKLAGKVGGWLSKLWGGGGGGGAADAVGGAASSAGGLGGGIASAASSSLSGWVQVGVSALSGIVSGIQQSHANNKLGEIEINTRSAFNEIFNLRRDQWDQFGGILSKFDMLYTRLGDMWGAIRNVGGSASAPAVGTTQLETIAYNTTLILSKFDQFILPWWQSDITPLKTAFATSGAAGGAGVFNFNNCSFGQGTTQGMIHDFMNQTVRMLRLSGARI